MKIIFIPLQILSLIGFALAAAVHILSLFGVVVFDPMKYLIIGLFLLWIPVSVVYREISISHALEEPRPSTWKIMFRRCPQWMKKFTVALLAYAAFNFFLCIVLEGSSYESQMDASRADLRALRLGSGHMMIFYWSSLAVYYSFMRRDEQVREE